MKMKTFFILLLVLIFITYGSSFGRKRISSCCKCNEQTLSKTDSCEEDENIVSDYYYDCDPNKFGIVQKIPYTRTGPGCDTLQIDFSSACIRCGMCLAIAEKVYLTFSYFSYSILQTIFCNNESLYKRINQTLLDVHEMMSPSACLNDTEVKLLLRTICDHSFQYYGLRQCDGRKFICDNLPGFTLLSTSADGLWGNKLRDLCHYYLDEIDEVQLYEQWKQWCSDEESTADMSDIICRSEMGLLRDCRNMKTPEKYEFPFNTYNAKVKITATYGKYGRH
ncbi:uncharacterized protein LOC143353866 [Halictus rubicundus]|uniref:uncharacterized protein LOC143353866 n=1 Tax=Halictus rubicundus TaxID=77578 RepID=UPI0040361244